VWRTLFTFPLEAVTQAQQEAERSTGKGVPQGFPSVRVAAIYGHTASIEELIDVRLYLLHNLLAVLFRDEHLPDWIGPGPAPIIEAADLGDSSHNPLRRSLRTNDRPHEDCLNVLPNAVATCGRSSGSIRKWTS
jgi:hypothetical protein